MDICPICPIPCPLSAKRCGNRPAFPQIGIKSAETRKRPPGFPEGLFRPAFRRLRAGAGASRRASVAARVAVPFARTATASWIPLYSRRPPRTQLPEGLAVSGGFQVHRACWICISSVLMPPRRPCLATGLQAKCTQVRCFCTRQSGFSGILSACRRKGHTYLLSGQLGTRRWAPACRHKKAPARRQRLFRYG